MRRSLLRAATAATLATSAPIALFHEAVTAIGAVANVGDQATTCPPPP